MPEAVSRIDIFQPACRYGHLKIFTAETMDAMPSERLTALIDKESLLICRFGLIAIFSDIHLTELLILLELSREIINTRRQCSVESIELS